MKSGYDINGKEMDIKHNPEIQENNNCVAYILTDNINQAHFVRVGTLGINNGKLLNPWGIYYNKGDEMRFNSMLGKRLFEFIKVNKDAYDLYVKFLQTKSEGYLNQAQRSI